MVIFHGDVSTMGYNPRVEHSIVIMSSSSLSVHGRAGVRQGLPPSTGAQGGGAAMGWPCLGCLK